MNQTISTYIHLPYEIRERLEHRAEKIQEEACRQSFAVSRYSDPSDDLWEDNIDDSEWKE